MRVTQQVVGELPPVEARLATLRFYSRITQLRGSRQRLTEASEQYQTCKAAKSLTINSQPHNTGPVGEAGRTASR